MATRATAVVLLKGSPSDGACKYETCLHELGARVWHVPVIETVEASDGKAQLQQFAAKGLGKLFWGAVVTSPRAADVLVETLGAIGSDIVCFAVGSETASRVKALGGTLFGGEDAGSAADLLPIVQQEYTDREVDIAGRKLLFPAGNIRRDTIPKGLQAANIPFEEICVYRTEEIREVVLPEDFMCVNPLPLERFIVFFSPSGVRSFTSSTAKLGKLSDSVRFVAIGKTTEKALIESALALHSSQSPLVSSSPSPTGVAAVIREHLKTFA